MESSHNLELIDQKQLNVVIDQTPIHEEMNVMGRNDELYKVPEAHNEYLELTFKETTERDNILKTNDSNR